jgi:hypothetical protein
VQEAVKLFEADCTRCAYTPRTDALVVSPTNARRVLGTFLKQAKRQLLIFDPKISDKEMISILRGRKKAGVGILIIGRITARAHLTVKRPISMRLHTRTIIRDQRQAFVGSQSLRSSELDSRRELGLIVRDSKIIKKLVDMFESDWGAHEERKDRENRKEEETESRKEESESLVKDTKKATRILVHQLQPVSLTLKKAVKKAVAVAVAGEEALEQKIVKSTVKKMVKRVVNDAVREVAREIKEI